jgi:tetraprenyl-beta-curcumene synthase
MTESSRRFPRNPVLLMNRMYFHVLPGVSRELENWRRTAELIPDAELRRQALASLASKRFHCQGGAVYAAANMPQRHLLIRLIVAFQTISDYLDNLCDRSTSLDPDDFRQLHRSMLDAIDPSRPVHDYYALREEKDDGGYLAALVAACQECISRLPSYGVVYPSLRELVALYGDLQVYKHIRRELREEALLNWWKENGAPYRELEWNEFAAATGSTLGMFMLFVAASGSGLTLNETVQIRRAYFPYVCGLHILLDYLIDQEEDRKGGDLNFCFYYPDGETAAGRIETIARRAREQVSGLPAPSFHRMIIEGLLALYLSDPKVSKQPEVRSVSGRLMKNSPGTRLFFWVNSLWIRKTSQ